MHILKASAIYFAGVFGVGFVLGPVRILWLVPQVGTRTAELLETPVMLVVIVLVARWVVRHCAIPPTLSQRLGVGLLALGFVLLMEFTVVLWLQGLTLKEYFAHRDPVAGAVYVGSLAVFAMMPLLVAR